MKNQKYRDFLADLEVLFAGEQYVSKMSLDRLQKAYQHCRTGFLRSVFSKDVRRIRFLMQNRKNYNQKFLQKEKRKKYEMGGFVLDKQQIEAVLACEDAALVLAPAGSGKTASLLAKVQYLVEGLGLDPRKILLISFTKKVEYELKERSQIKGVEIRTFHSLGNKILKQFDRSKKRKILEEGMMERFLMRTIRSLVRERANFARELYDFLLFDFTRSTFGERILTEEERQIAIWLRLHNIKYDYCRQYQWLETNYHPDFTLEVEGEKIYIEYYTVDRAGENLRGKRVKQRQWRQKIHRTHKTTLVELFAYEWQEGNWQEQLSKKLKKLGVEVERSAPAKVATMIKNDQRALADFGALKKMFGQVLVLQKNNMMSLGDFGQKIAKMPDVFQCRRAERFFSIYQPIYDAYQRYLAENQRFDFADMINEAIEIIQQEPERAMEYDYILVDEVQDLSFNRYQLVKALLDKNPQARLFAVGDDWQAIYRFAGSDLSLIENFEQVFGRETYKSMIELTHRFGQPTIDLSGKFIQKNPEQSRKAVRGGTKTKTPIQIILNRARMRRGEPIDYEALNKFFNKLDQKGKIQGKTVQVIARHNRDVERILGRDKTGKLKKLYKKVSIAKRENGLVTDLKWRLESGRIMPLSFCSIHKAKGITRDIVVVINMDGGTGGMPATRKNDPIVELLLTAVEKYPLAEERRLFYVAITRARQLTALVGDEWNQSPFLKEIQDEMDKKEN